MVSTRLPFTPMAFLVSALALAACGDGETRPAVASIEVTSALDSLIPVGVSTQMTAVARDRQGAPLDVTIEWTSSATDVAIVNASGLAAGVGAGMSEIHATVSPASPVEVSGAVGSFRLTVLDADLPAMERLLADPLVAHLVAALGTARGPVEDALDGCNTGLATGRLVDVVECLDGVNAQAASATDGTDRALLAVLTLFTEFTRSLLNP